jgi:predicted O-methyltransferase YrrM
MSRLLYALSDTFRPKNQAVIGSAEANALIWLALPVLPTAHKILGMDLDEEGNSKTSANLTSLGAEKITIKTLDGREAKSEFKDKIDLLFIDVWSAGNGKSDYFDILEQAYPALAEGALILAHDITYPKFRNDLAGYLCMVRNENRFRCSCSIPIDRYGLEVTIR